jgi:hypothetical protein
MCSPLFPQSAAMVASLLLTKLISPTSLQKRKKGPQFFVQIAK